MIESKRCGCGVDLMRVDTDTGEVDVRLRGIVLSPSEGGGFVVYGQCPACRSRQSYRYIVCETRFFLQICEKQVRST